MSINDRAYHIARAASSHLMASNAVDDRVRGIHLDLASRYEALAAETTVVSRARPRPAMSATKRFETRQV